MKFRIIFWDVLPCKIIVDRRFRGTASIIRRPYKTNKYKTQHYGLSKQMVHIVTARPYRVNEGITELSF
jgi:hypothetical protein